MEIRLDCEISGVGGVVPKHHQRHQLPAPVREPSKDQIDELRQHSQEIGPTIHVYVCSPHFSVVVISHRLLRQNRIDLLVLKNLHLRAGANQVVVVDQDGALYRLEKVARPKSQVVLVVDENGIKSRL